MAWSASAIFTQAVFNPLTASAIGFTAKPTGYLTSGLLSDTIKAALFTSSITPDKNAAVLSTGYNTAGSQWLQAGEVSDTNWPSGGVALSGKAYSVAAGIVNFTASNTPGSGNVTLAQVYGCLVYDDTVSGGTVAKQGYCFNYFGGVQSVTGGTFTIVWDATGVFKFTT
jgi:hypothetical protein